MHSHGRGRPRPCHAHHTNVQRILPRHPKTQKDISQHYTQTHTPLPASAGPPDLLDVLQLDVGHCMTYTPPTIAVATHSTKSADDNTPLMSSKFLRRDTSHQLALRSHCSLSSRSSSLEHDSTFSISRRGRRVVRQLLGLGYANRDPYVNSVQAARTGLCHDGGEGSRHGGDVEERAGKCGIRFLTYQ